MGNIALLIPFLLMRMTIFGQVKSQFDILLLETSKGKIIYADMSNYVFYSTWTRSELKLKFTAKENCKISEHGGFISVTPDTNAKYSIVNIAINDSINQDFLFFVQKLPTPSLFYNDNNEIEKQNLPTEIELKNISNLKSLEALVEIGRLSWRGFEIKKYELLIILKNDIVERLINEGSIMSEMNFNKLMTLKSGDTFCFINIECKDSRASIKFNERAIIIK